MNSLCNAYGKMKTLYQILKGNQRKISLERSRSWLEDNVKVRFEGT